MSEPCRSLSRHGAYWPAMAVRPTVVRRVHRRPPGRPRRASPTNRSTSRSSSPCTTRRTTSRRSTRRSSTALKTLGRSYEIIVVDDGSRDDTYQRLVRLADADDAFKLIKLRRNFGQTAAMAAGFDHAAGDVVVPMDGDLQNDPADIPRCSPSSTRATTSSAAGGRTARTASSRRLPSRIANWLIGRVTGVRLHDYGCTLKAYRAEVIAETRLYGEMHRFIPALAYQAGARITEMPVRHHPRASGQQQVRLGRTFKVLLDLLTVKFLSVWSTKPSYVFGGSGAILCFLGIAVRRLDARTRSVVNGVYVYRQPSLLVGVFLFTSGSTHPPGPARRAGRPDVPRVTVEADLPDPRACATSRSDRRSRSGCDCHVRDLRDRRPRARSIAEALGRMTARSAPPRPGRRGLLRRRARRRRRRRPRPPAAGDHRPRRPATSRSPTRTGRSGSSSTARSTTSASCARSSRRAGTASRRTPTPR